MMKRSLILLICGFPVATFAATPPHSTQYYFEHPSARVALEMQCYPGSNSSVAADNCRNAWQAGRRILQSVVKAPQRMTGWGSLEKMASAGRPSYPNAPEEQTSNPVYWRIRGQARTQAFLTNWASCPAHPSALFVSQCKAAQEALAAPWQSTEGGQK